MVSRRLSFAAAALVAMGLAVRLFGLDRTTLWYDEVQTARAVGLPLGALVHERLTETHSPAYFLLLKLLGVATDSIVALRLPSVVFGAATVWAGILAARAFHSRRAGWAAGCLFALTPILVDYGQEARPYAAMLLGVVVALGGAARVLRHPRAAASVLRRAPPAVAGRRRRMVLAAWLPLTAGSVWAVLMQPLGALLWLALDLAFVGEVVAGGRTWRRLARPWLAHRLLAALVCLPLALSLLPALRARVGDYWFALPTAGELWQQLAQAQLFRFQGDPDRFAGRAGQGLLAALLLVAAAAGIAALRRRRAALGVALAAWLVPVVVLGAMTLHTPVWLDRYLLVATPAFTLLVSAGLAHAWRWRAGRALVGVFALLGLLQLGDLWHGARRADWRPLIAALSASPEPVFLVAAHEHQVREIAFEWRRERRTGGPAFARFGVDGHPRPEAAYLFLREPDLGVPLRGLAAGNDRSGWIAWLAARGVLPVDLAPAKVAGEQVGATYRPPGR